MPPEGQTLQFIGGQYVGDTANGVPEGNGKYTYDNGDVCWGQFIDGIMQGKGVFQYANGDYYEGEFKNDKPHGVGMFKFKDGTVYEGSFHEEVMSGHGKMLYADGRVYEGEMEGDKRHGRGTMTLPSGDFYDGEWVQGRKHGKGFYRFANGDTYEGDYVQDVKEGYGVFRWANGDVYEGGVKNGVRHGEGTLRLAGGEMYVGNFVDGKEDGRQMVYKATPAPEMAETVAAKEFEPELLLQKSESATKLTLQSKGRRLTNSSVEEVAAAALACAASSSASALDDDDGALTDADFKDWKRGNILGKGAFGAVYLGLLSNGKFVAAKTVEFGSDSSPEDLQVFQQELALMKQLRHKNIVRYLGSEYLPDQSILNMFVEYVPQGTLSQVTRKFNTLPVSTVRSMTRQILEGLEYLHCNDIIHRDIKGENILLDNEGTIKLADFGCSKKLDALCSKTHGCNTMVGTPYWMAPEVITNEQGYGFKADIWSVGCTIVEMLTSKPPWPEFDSMWQAVYHIAKSTGPPPNIPQSIVEENPDLGDLLAKCFERDVALRPGASELLRHPFLAVAAVNGSPRSPSSPAARVPETANRCASAPAMSPRPKSPACPKAPSAPTAPGSPSSSTRQPVVVRQPSQRVVPAPKSSPLSSRGSSSPSLTAAKPKPAAPPSASSTAKPTSSGYGSPTRRTIAASPTTRTTAPPARHPPAK